MLAQEKGCCSLIFMSGATGISEGVEGRMLFEVVFSLTLMLTEVTGNLSVLSSLRLASIL